MPTENGKMPIFFVVPDTNQARYTTVLTYTTTKKNTIDPQLGTIGMEKKYNDSTINRKNPTQAESTNEQLTPSASTCAGALLAARAAASSSACASTHVQRFSFLIILKSLNYKMVKTHTNISIKTITFYLKNGVADVCKSD